MEKGQSNPAMTAEQGPPPAYPGNQPQYGFQQGGYQAQAYPGAQPNNNVVLVHQQQPGVGVIGFNRGPPPKDYFGFSIFTLLFCNLICGGIALMFAKESRDKHYQGDSIGAQSASKNSLILNVVAVVSGIITYVVIIVIYVTYWNTLTYVYG